MSEPIDQQGEISVGLRLQKARMEKKLSQVQVAEKLFLTCLLYTSPSPRDVEESRMPSSA